MLSTVEGIAPPPPLIPSCNFFRLMPSRVKEGQVRCIVPFLLRKDVFVVLPTGFGKSIIFQMKNYLTNFSVSECHVNSTSRVSSGMVAQKNRKIGN